MGILISLLCVLLGLSIAGCGVSQVYRDSNSPQYGEVSRRADWRVVGSLIGIEKAIDGNVHTAAVGKVNAGAANLTIDLGKACLFNMVVIDHGQRELGFPKRLAVLTSMDGVSFSRQYEAQGTRRISIFSLPSPVLARYVRLQEIQPGYRPLSVAEVFFQ